MIRHNDSRDILVTRFEIDVEDTFHFKNLYKMIFNWMPTEGFISAGGKQPEVYYWERRFANGASEHQIWWRFMKVPDNNSYYRFYLKVDFQSLNMQGAETTYDSKKVKTNKGEVIIRVQAWLQLDLNNEWEKAPLLKYFERMFRNRIHLQQIEQYKATLEGMTERLRNNIKQYLELQMPYQPQKGFWAERGV